MLAYSYGHALTWCPIALAAQGLVPILGRWWCQVSVLPVSLARLDTDFHADPLQHTSPDMQIPSQGGTMSWFGTQLFFLCRVLSPYLKGGGAKSLDFQSLSQDLIRTSMQIPFSVPPYMSLLARSTATLEGIALMGDPNYQMVSQVTPCWLQACGICKLCLPWTPI